jgi:hypothetical protein
MNGFRVFAPAMALAGLGLLLAACAAGESPAYSARQMAQVAAATQTGLSGANMLTPEDEGYAHRLEEVYLLDAETILDGAVHYIGGTEAGEIAVLELAENASPEQAAAAMRRYLENRAGSFAGYFPRQAEIAEAGVVAVKGNYLALLACEEPAKAEEAFLRCFGENPPALPEPADPESAIPAFKAITATPPELEPEPPEEAEEPAKPARDDIYNRKAILAAWNGGDSSSLTPQDKEILDICTQTIAEIITEGMTQLDKELAVHDWICGWTEYDDGLFGEEEDEGPHPESNNPYGPLVRRKAICGGYSHTFQLFMDLLEIECITVRGTSWSGDERHMWNMVRLDDEEWYCVDVTWDDTAGDHRYFNVTSDFMRENDHQWNEATTPEATSKKYM